LDNYHLDSQHLHKQECGDPWLLFTPKGAREQKLLENTATMHTLLLQCSRWIQLHRNWKTVILTTFLAHTDPNWCNEMLRDVKVIYNYVLQKQGNNS